MIRLVPLLLLALSPALAQVLTLPLGGALLYLAREAGYTLEYGNTLPELLRPVPVDLSQRGGLDAFRALLEAHVPGRYLLEEREGRVLRLTFTATPAPSRRPEAPTPSAKPLTHFFLFADGSLKEAEGEGGPLKVSAVVQEGAPSLSKGESSRSLSLSLSPAEITCLEEARQAVCLQPLFLFGEGVVELPLPKGPLKLHYRVEADPPILRRYSLDGTLAPIPLLPSPATRRAPTPVQ